MKKRLLTSLALAVVASFGVIGTANALSMLDGGPSMTATYTLVDSLGASASITTATGIDSHIFVYGLGLMRAVGYDDTPGVWNFTGQGVKDAHFSWSTSAGAEPAPELATMLLLGTGLIGLASISRCLSKMQHFNVMFNDFHPINTAQHTGRFQDIGDNKE